MEVNFNLIDDEGGCHSTDVRPADPTSDVSLEIPHDDDVVEVFGRYDDTTDWGNWSYWVCGKLKDGRYFLYEENGDYTFSGAVLTVASSREELERYGLDASQRKMLGVSLSEL